MREHALVLSYNTPWRHSADDLAPQGVRRHGGLPRRVRCVQLAAHAQMDAAGATISTHVWRGRCECDGIHRMPPGAWSRRQENDGNQHTTRNFEGRHVPSSSRGRGRGCELVVTSPSPFRHRGCLYLDFEFGGLGVLGSRIMRVLVRDCNAR